MVVVTPEADIVPLGEKHTEVALSLGHTNWVFYYPILTSHNWMD